MKTMRAIAFASLALALLLGTTGVAAADQRSEALRIDAYDAAYNMDHERALDLFRQAVAADPNDAAAWRGAASVIWLRVLFLRGTVLVEDYLGRLKGSGDVKVPEPPADLDKAFHEYIDKAIALGQKEVDRKYKDASAHYDLGAALGLAASYSATVEGKVGGSLRLARRSYSESLMVLELDERRKEVGLVLGTYRYLVSTLPMVVRWMAYIVGFDGGKDQGIRLIEEAAAYPSDIQADARFALVLMYNREARYADAIKVLQGLTQSFPRNRLIALEEGSTFLRGNRPVDALRVLDEGIARLPQDSRPRMPGEVARWHLKRGSARLRLGMLNEAEEDLKTSAANRDARGWVLARIHVEMGKVADLRGERARAQSEYRAAGTLAKSVGDEEIDAEATKLLAQPYRNR
jgi:tetratricopeptide (TPR) repeat protein